MAMVRTVYKVQFDVGGTQRFQLFVGDGVLPTTGLTCQVRLQRVNSAGVAAGDPITVNAVAEDASWWRFTWTAPMTATPGDYHCEARIDTGAGEVQRFPVERMAMLIVRPARTGGTA